MMLRRGRWLISSILTCVVVSIACGATRTFAVHGRLFDQMGRPHWPAGHIEIPSLRLRATLQSDASFRLAGKAEAGCYLAWVRIVGAAPVAITFDPARRATQRVGNIHTPITPIEEPSTQAVVGCGYPQDSIDINGWGVDTIRALR